MLYFDAFAVHKKVDQNFIVSINTPYKMLVKLNTEEKGLLVVFHSNFGVYCIAFKSRQSSCTILANG